MKNSTKLAIVIVIVLALVALLCSCQKEEDIVYDVPQGCHIPTNIDGLNVLVTWEDNQGNNESYRSMLLLSVENTHCYEFLIPGNHSSVRGYIWTNGNESRLSSAHFNALTHPINFNAYIDNPFVTVTDSTIEFGGAGIECPYNTAHKINFHVKIYRP